MILDEVCGPGGVIVTPCGFPLLDIAIGTTIIDHGGEFGGGVKVDFVEVTQFLAEKRPVPALAYFTQSGRRPLLIRVAMWLCYTHTCLNMSFLSH